MIVVLCFEILFGLFGGGHFFVSVNALVVLIYNETKLEHLP